VAVISRSTTLAVSVSTILVVALAGLTGCGSSSKDAGSSSAGSTTGSSTGSSAVVSSAAGGATADAATTAAATKAFVTLFDGTATLDTRLAVLQNGTSLAQALSALASSPLIKQTSATVSKVTLTSPNQAQVTYTLAVSGTPIAKDQAGTAVQDSGTWKVSASTFCALLTAEGQPQPVCTQASITSLPS
jgi:hypothetical protein